VFVDFGRDCGITRLAENRFRRSARMIPDAGTPGGAVSVLQPPETIDGKLSVRPNGKAKHPR